jgi:hypothetical protein
VDGLEGNAAYNDGQTMLNNLIHNLLLDDISQTSRQALEKQLENPDISQVSLFGHKKGIYNKKLAALVLSVPEFQKR